VTDKKIIAVVGATGSQGGGLVRAILGDPDQAFAVRAITRDATSATALAVAGAEVVEADLDDEASLRAAFRGAFGAFVVTNFLEQLTPEEEAARSRSRREREQAQNAARAAKAAGLKHVVWSTLVDTRPQFAYRGSTVPTIEGDFKVPPFDGKAEANEFFTSSGVPTTFLETTLYYELLPQWAPQRDHDGRLALSIPMGDSVLALVAAEDIGRTAYGIFRAGPRFLGRTVSLAGAHVTGEQLAAAFSESLGETVVYRPMTHDQLRTSGAPLADVLANLFQFFTEADDAFVGNQDLDLIRTLNPRLTSLSDWLAANPLPVSGRD
jgi:uncharacterized protein YbjT (DUF2867 family)